MVTIENVKEENYCVTNRSLFTNKSKDMKKYWYWNEEDAITRVQNALRQNKVIAGTSDTIIGLLAPLTHEGKIALDRIKQRVDKPYIILVKDYATATRFSSALQQPALQKLLQACWPGPLTVIVPAAEQVPDYVRSTTGAIAIRVPQHPGLQNLLQSFDGLFSTSANITGEPVPTSLKELDQNIARKVAIIIDDHTQRESKPSTIIDCTGSDIKLVREGAYSKKMLEQYITLQKIVLFFV